MIELFPKKEFDFSDIMNANLKKEEKLRLERQKANKQILRRYRIKK